jgi:DNA-directed RNA polymerase specialized sigma24 family protein
VDQQDEEEFAKYFAARRDAVRRTAYLLCGDWHRADDLAQTAFVALHRHWSKIREKAALDAYVRRTLTRAVIAATMAPGAGGRDTAGGSGGLGRTR